MQTQGHVKRTIFQGLPVLLVLLTLVGCVMPTPPTEATSTTLPEGTPASSLPPGSIVGTPIPTVTAAMLEGTSWQLVSFGAPGAALPLLADSTITLEFGANGEAVGSGGCNSYGGEYQAEENRLTFGELVSTLRACLDEGVTQQELHYLEALQGASRFEIDGGTLTIWYDNESGLLNFIPATVAPPLETSATPTATTPLTTTAPMTVAAGTPPERIDISAGATLAQISGRLPGGGGSQQYILMGASGQTIEVRVTSADAPVSFTLDSPTGVTWSGERLGSGIYIAAQTVTLPEEGEYLITVTAPEGSPETAYDLTLTFSRR